MKGELTHIMSLVVESLKRLYMKGEVAAEYINARQSLSDEEKEYILSDEPVLDDTYENAYKILKGELA